MSKPSAGPAPLANQAMTVPPEAPEKVCLPRDVRERRSPARLQMFSSDLETGPSVVSPLRISAQIKAAIYSHAAWKVRLRTAVLAGGSMSMKPEEAAADNRCALGMWLYGDALDAETKSSAPYLAVLRCHAEFHRSSGRILSYAQAGNRTATGRLMHDEFIPLSEQLVQLLTEWDQYVRTP